MQNGVMKVDVAAKRRKKHKGQNPDIVISIGYDSMFDVHFF